VEEWRRERERRKGRGGVWVCVVQQIAPVLASRAQSDPVPDARLARVGRFPHRFWFFEEAGRGEEGEGGLGDKVRKGRRGRSRMWCPEGPRATGIHRHHHEHFEGRG
jgi:hypothetical protein